MALVVPDDTSEILTVPEVLAEIGAADTATVQRYINAATELVESHVGPVIPRLVTQQVTDTSGIVLLKGRVVSLVSVTDVAGTPLTGYSLNAAAGVLTGHLYGATVSYVAGFDPIPESIRLAVLYIVQHAHESGLGAVVNGQGAGDEVFTLSRGFFLPNRAKELLQPYMLPALP